MKGFSPWPGRVSSRRAGRAPRPPPPASAPPSAIFNLVGVPLNVTMSALTARNVYKRDKWRGRSVCAGNDAARHTAPAARHGPLSARIWPPFGSRVFSNRLRRSFSARFGTVRFSDELRVVRESGSLCSLWKVLVVFVLIV